MSGPDDTIEPEPVDAAFELADAPDNAHPLARVHPDTGRTAIFVGMHASHIEGKPFDEGRALVLRLEEHATQPRYQYRHSWRPGDLLMWDNCTVQHKASFDYALPQRRMMQRCTIEGDVPA